MAGLCDLRREDAASCKRSCLERQLLELELVEAMYEEAEIHCKDDVEALRLWIDEDNDDDCAAWERFLSNDGAIAFSIPFANGGIALTVKFPSEYPSNAPLHAHVDLLRAGVLTSEGLAVLDNIVEAAASRLLGNEAVVDLLSEFSDMLADVVQKSAQAPSKTQAGMIENAPASIDVPLIAQAAPVLGRRAIYSHHIIAEGKRRAVMEWAVQCRLGKSVFIFDTFNFIHPL